MTRYEYKELHDNSKWSQWYTDAQKARQELINADAASLPVKVDNALYKRMKDEIFAPFHYKCAFCETSLGSQHGDVEHFRPKKGVTDENDRPIRILGKDDTEQNHPGYFWLAYDWKNLLPSCTKCNQPSTRGNLKVGKRNRFPIRDNSKRWCHPDNECNEEPLLLHPYFDEPTQHLGVDLETGVMFSLSERGRMCIDIFDLNRDDLIEDRRTVFRLLQGYWSEIHQETARTTPNYAEKLNELIAHKDGKKHHTMVARKAIERFIAERKKVDEIMKPTPEEQEAG